MIFFTLCVCIYRFFVVPLYAIFDRTIMKRILRYLGALLFAGMPFSVILGENITHNFQLMNTEPRTIKFQSNNKYAFSTTDAITYTCGRNAVFDVVNNQVGIKLYDDGDEVIVAPAIDGLYEVYIGYIIVPTTFKTEDIEVYISSDGSKWEGPLTDGVTPSSGSVTATIPRGNYQLKIRNKGNNDIVITNMTYFFEHCNCFRYVP